MSRKYMAVIYTAVYFCGMGGEWVVSQCSYDCLLAGRTQVRHRYFM